MPSKPTLTFNDYARQKHEQLEHCSGAALRNYYHSYENLRNAMEAPAATRAKAAKDLPALMQDFAISTTNLVNLIENAHVPDNFNFMRDASDACNKFYTQSKKQEATHER